MNRELKTSGLFAPEPDEEDRMAMDFKLTGYLGPLSSPPIQVRDVALVVATVYMHNACGASQAALLYLKNRRIALIQPFSGETALHISGIEVGDLRASGDRIVAAGWFISNCTSTWNGSALSVDLARNGKTRRILNTDPGARQLEDITVTIDQDIVTFRYIAGLADAQVMQRAGIARYRISGNQARRIAPVALNIGGFVDEWIHMPDAEAARWSSPAAAREHASVRRDFSKNTFRWRSLAHCGDHAEVGVEVNDTKKNYVFSISGSKAADLRMAGISGEHSCGAQVLPSQDFGLAPIFAELPN
jgi:hypothetical protein